MIDIYKNFTFEYSNDIIGNSVIIHADCFEWFCKIPKNSIHAIVTDPLMRLYHLAKALLLIHLWDQGQLLQPQKLINIMQLV